MKTVNDIWLDSRKLFSCNLHSGRSHTTSQTHFFEAAGHEECKVCKGRLQMYVLKKNIDMDIVLQVINIQFGTDTSHAHT